MKEISRPKRKSVATFRIPKRKLKTTNKTKAKQETRIKQFNKLANNCRNKKSTHKRRKIRGSNCENENIQNLINIKTQIKEVNENISFAYDSIDINSNPNINDTFAKVSTSKFPLNDVHSGEESMTNSLLK